MNGLLEFIKALRDKYPQRVIESWLQEFGYAFRPGFDIHATLAHVAAERGPRLERELDLHGKRLAEFARMASVPAGRAAVIR